MTVRELLGNVAALSDMDNMGEQKDKEVVQQDTVKRDDGLTAMLGKLLRESHADEAGQVGTANNANVVRI